MNEKTVLGRTGLVITSDGFGALPIQRTPMDEAVKILKKVLDGGINFIDTARAYTDSEEKIGRAVSDRRNEFFIATKTQAKTADAFWKDLETSLSLLKTDHIDIYQFHFPDFCPKPGDTSGLYDAALKAREQGKIRFIGLTNHKLPLAKEAVESGLYDTLQFPLSYLSSDIDLDLVRLCAEKNMGFIAMKALSGGLITGIGTARSWFLNVPPSYKRPDTPEAEWRPVPIWGIQKESELDELFAAQKTPAGTALSAEARARIEADRKELAGDFCRGCGYCLPCSAGIIINNCARMPQMIRRMPPQQFLTDRWKAEMEKISNCTGCRLCVSRCPYSLDTPQLLKKAYEDYKTFVA